MIELKHLSYSSVNLYTTCARAWRYRYVDKAKTPTSVNLVFGSAVHGAIQSYLVAKSGKLQGHKASVEFTQVWARPVDYWPQAWAKQLEDPRNAVISYGNETPESIAALGKRVLGNRNIAAKIAELEPMTGTFETRRGQSTGPMIERKTTLRVPGVPVPVIGYIDLITADGVPMDFKTAGKMWHEGREHHEVQATFYLSGLNQMGWKLNSERLFRYLIITKGQNPQADMRETDRTTGQLLWLLGHIKDTWDAIQSEAFPPSGADSWKCSPKWCEYWLLCRGL